MASHSQFSFVIDFTSTRHDDTAKPLIRQRARSKSRPRVLYAPENEISGRGSADFTALDIVKEDPIKLNIRGLRRTFYPPIHHPPVDNSAPDKKLHLQWVHGYRGLDTRKNLWVLPSGELLYFVAAVAVLYDRDEETQRHYTGHTEDIMRLVHVYFIFPTENHTNDAFDLVQHGCTSITRTGRIGPTSRSR